MPSTTHVTAQEVVGALRYTRDELQVTRVLHAICGEPKVARAFLVALFNEAGKSTNEIPRHLRITTEEELSVPVSRGHRKLGRSDLLFSTSDWSCVVECKIDADLKASQVEKYLESGADYVIVLGRSNTKPRLTGVVASHPRLGRVAWEAVVPAFRRFSFKDAGAAAAWMAFLSVLEAHEDFAREKPRGTAAAEASFRVLTDLTDRLKGELVGVARNAYSWDEEGPLTTADVESAACVAYSGPWARLDLGFVGQDYWTCSVVLRLGGTPAPTVEFRWFPWSERRSSPAAMRLLRAMEATPRRDRAFTIEPTKALAWTFSDIQEPDPERRQDQIVKRVRIALDELFTFEAHEDWRLDEMFEV